MFVLEQVGEQEGKLFALDIELNLVCKVVSVYLFRTNPRNGVGFVKTSQCRETNSRIKDGLDDTQTLIDREGCPGLQSTFVKQSLFESWTDLSEPFTRIDESFKVVATTDKLFENPEGSGIWHSELNGDLPHAKHLHFKISDTTVSIVHYCFPIVH